MAKKKILLSDNPEALHHKPPSMRIRELGFVDVKICHSCKTIEQIPDVNYKKKDQICNFCGLNKLEFSLARWVPTTKWWHFFFETGNWVFNKE